MGLKENVLFDKGKISGGGDGDVQVEKPRIVLSDKSILSPPIIKSPRDKSEYRGLTLENGMKVLLLSYPGTDKAAASLSVAVGSMNDPADLPGLAHFCEHMLFLGTEKYPEENEYTKYLTQNGGSYNATTYLDQTNYYFDVSPSSLQGALDRFSQFFISPLFTESGTEREVNAVNSEHEQDLASDSARLCQLDVGTTNRNHPYSRFSNGNRETLWTRPREKGIDIRKALMDFHRSHYSANLMCLAVMGSEILDELQQLVEDHFLDVVNQDVPLPVWPENPYGPPELQSQLEVVPINDIRTLDLLFPVPEMSAHYKTGSVSYLYNLIGHEGHGSLLSLLKERNWVTALTAGSDVPARGFAVFTVSVDLTPEGFQNTDDIVETIFQYLEMLREGGPQPWFWEEIRDISAMGFQFMEEGQPLFIVTGLSTAMHRIPLQDVPSMWYIYSECRPDLITRVLAQLTPDNVRVTIVSKEFESKTKLVEEWHGVKYNYEKLDQKLIQKWKNCGRNAKLKLPPKNDFLPTDFDLKRREDEGAVPKIILDTPLTRLWFLQDNEFMTPKAIVKVEIFSLLPLRDPVSSTLHTMLATVIADSLTEYSSQASLAGLQYYVSETDYGLTIHVSGYNEKVGLLLNKVFEKLVHLEVDPGRFEVLKEAYLRSLKTWENWQPSSLASYYSSYLLTEKAMSNPELINAMEGVTLEALKSYGKDFLAKVNFQWLILGNLNSDEATDMVNDSVKLFEKEGTQPLLASEMRRVREIELPLGSNYIYKSEQKTHLDSCVQVLFQTGVQATHENVVAQLLAQILGEPLMYQLRTKEQLGYGVYSWVHTPHGTLGIGISVQGERHPAFLESRIDSFLKQFQETLMTMTEEEFLKHRTALGVVKAEKVKHLWGRAELFWGQIYSQQYQFDRQQLELEELERITLDHVKAFFMEFISLESDKKRRLSIHVLSMAEGAAGHKVKGDNMNGDTTPTTEEKKILEIGGWKGQRRFYPRRSPKPIPICSWGVARMDSGK